MRSNILIYIFCAAVFMTACEKESAPVVLSFSPEFGPPETLITVEGSGLGNLTTLSFNEGVFADFNASFGADHAVLFRVPENAPLGENTITFGNSAGQTTIPFRVTKKAPVLKSYFPESGSPGQTVTFLGENFFEPIEVLFFDSVSAKILHIAEDSVVAEIPEGVEKGKIKLKANGGNVLTQAVFFTTQDILVNDFDGNGLRSETSKWLFYGAIDQTANDAVQGTSPVPIDGQFLKLTGKDPGSTWIGGTENHSWDLVDFDVFDIKSDINNTFIEADLNSNGKDKTHVILVLVERNGSFNDFTTQIHVDWDGWETVSVPLNRFKDLDGLTIDPQKIRAVKVHLINNDSSTGKLEVNIDNLKFVQIN